MKVVTRFAPSPTGYFHAGSYRTALFSWIYAKQKDGKFILRIEDTDKERSKKEYEENIVESLKWLGLEYDEFYRQSDRTDIYKKYIKQLIASGHAYETTSEQETAKAGEPRKGVIRFKNPNKKVAFDDLIRGRVEFDTTELGDFVIAKNEDEPIFHLVVVIDDHDMGVTHVIRGEEHISNTPRQILILEALNKPILQYAHIPLLLASDRSKLSKRKGAIAVSEYRNRGYLPKALVNYFALLGWHPTDDKEILTLEEIVKEFTLERVQKSGAIFDDEKLKWFNRQYMLKLSDADFSDRVKPFLPDWVVPNSETFKRLIPVLRDKAATFAEVTEMLGPRGDMSFVHRISEYPVDMLLWKKKPDKAVAAMHLKESFSTLSDIDQGQFSAETIKSSIWPYVETNGKGDVLWPLRVALTGQEKSPDPFVSAALLGKDESLKRIETALRKLSV